MGSINGDMGERIIGAGHDLERQWIPFGWGSKDGGAGEQTALSIAPGGQTDLGGDGPQGEQTIDAEGVSILESHFIGARHNPGEHRFPSERGSKIGGSRERKTGEQTAEMISLLSAPPVPRLQQRQPSGGVEDEQAPQWLKAVLPEANNGWWDVYLRGTGFAVKFCWRAGGPQKLTFPRIDLGQFQDFKQRAAGEVKEIFRAQITGHLQSLLRDPARRDKALAVARKLGIYLDNYQAQETANSSETNETDE